MTHKYDRRSGSDRRQRELSFLGRVERRKRVEARKPEIVELKLSETEWDDYFGNGFVRARKATRTSVASTDAPPVATRAVARKHKTRSDSDRRQEEFGHPGKKERRKMADLRKPEIVEVELSDTEWQMQFGNLRVTERQIVTAVNQEES